MARRLTLIISPLVFLLIFGGPASAHKIRTQGTDPTANSPAGVVYSIPLDTARNNAAPHTRPSGSNGAIGGSNDGSGGGTGSGSGGPSGAGSAGSGSGKGSSLLVSGGQPGSLIHSNNGYGSSSLIPGVTGPLPAGFRSIDGPGSSAPTLAILISVLVLALGALAGAGAWRAVRTR